MSLTSRPSDFYKRIVKHGARIADQGGQALGRVLKRKFKEYQVDRNKNMVDKKRLKRNVGKIFRGSAINQLAGRAAVKSRGKKVKVKALKSVKVSKGLRDKVKKVIAGTDAYGEYCVRIGGMIGYVDTKQAVANLPIAGLVSRDGAYVYKYDSGPAMKSGNKVWWGGLIKVTTGAFAAPEVRKAFLYFTPAKILDAVSCLFNQKPMLPDWTIPNQNFTYATALSTGAGFVGSSTFPTTGAFKCYVHNAYANWIIKNVNQRTVKLKIYHCVSKLKFNDSGPLTALSRVDGLNDNTNFRSELGSFSSGAGVPIVADTICHPMFEPKKHPHFSSSWKYDVTEIVLKPGEEMTHFIQGPKNYELNFEKLLPDGNTEVGAFFKDTTKAIMVSLEIDSVLYSPDGTASLNVGQLALKSAAGTTNNITNPISIEVDEVYKVSCPANAGFITTAGVAGTIQSLNLKGNRKLFANFNDVPLDTTVYTSYNEENPGAPIVESITN